MSTTEGINAQSSSTSRVVIAQGLREHSCLLCKQRKVKCDRRDPCSNCTKARVDCIFRAPAPPRRRKKTVPEASLISRLKQYEEMLIRYGEKLEATTGEHRGDSKDCNSDTDTDPLRIINSVRHNQGDCTSLTGSSHKVKPASRPTMTGGKMILENGKSRYLENHLFNTLSDKFRNPQEMLQGPDDDEDDDDLSPNALNAMDLDGGDLVLGTYSASSDRHILHPQPVHIFRLWQVFLDNINPLTKIIHAPSLQQLICEACGNLNSIPNTTNALIFAVYFAALTSISDVDCKAMFDEPKGSLLARFHLSTQRALVKARFLKSSDLAVLQAFVLFLISARQFYDPRSLWTLTGLAVRIGQRMGLHRDGLSLGLSLFESEIRRRVWWLIAILDSTSAELSGSRNSGLPCFENLKLPLNVNDSDLNPSMTELPAHHARPTEMIFCMIRYEFGMFLVNSQSSKLRPATSFDGVLQGFLGNPKSLSEKEKAIGEFERHLEDKYLRYCDRVTPLHFISLIVARTGITVIKFRIHSYLQALDQGATISHTEQDALFVNALKIIESYNLAHSSKIMQRFLWHTTVQFHWHALIHALSELRKRTIGDEVDKAWQQIGEVYKNHPEILSEGKSALSRAVGNLTLKAWEAHEAACMAHFKSLPFGGRPQYITTLRFQRMATKKLEPVASLPEDNVFAVPVASEAVHRQVDNQPQPHKSFNDPSVTNPDNFFLPDQLSDASIPVDWALWDSLMLDFELQPASSSALGSETQFFDHD